VRTADSMTMRVSVIDAGTVTDAEAERAEAVGRLGGERGHALVCGGLGGAMEAACRGASEAGATTIGVLPGEDRASANPHVEVPIATVLGHAPNGLVVLNGEAVVAIDGGPGTLSEPEFAGVFDWPVAGLGTHDEPGVEPVGTPLDAVEYVESAVGSDLISELLSTPRPSFHVRAGGVAWYPSAFGWP